MNTTTLTPVEYALAIADIKDSDKFTSIKVIGDMPKANEIIISAERESYDTLSYHIDHFKINIISLTGDYRNISVNAYSSLATISVML